MIANLTMETDKRLAFAEMFDIYQHELEADTLHITVPRYYGTQDLSQTECRICFALGKQGDYAVLRQHQMTERMVVYQYRLGGALTSQSGEYQLWLEFYIFDPQTHLPTWHLCSEMKKVTVQAHKNGEQLFSPPQMTYLEDLTTQLHALQDTTETEVAEAAQKAEHAMQKVDQMTQSTGQTLTEQNTTLQDHAARLARLERGVTQEYSAGVGNVDDYLRSSDLKWYDGTWSVGGYQLTESEAKEGFRTFLIAWEQDNTAVMYLDRGATVASSQVSRLTSPPCAQTSWGYLIYFPSVNLTVCVTANERSGDTLVPGTLATAQNLCVLFARGNCFATEDMRSITALEGTVSVAEPTQELVLDLGEAERKAASAGKRIFGISFYYMLGDAVEETTPIYPVSAFGRETLLAKGTGLSLRREVQGLVANIAPDLFGWSYWLDYEDGASLQYRLELI